MASSKEAEKLLAQNAAIQSRKSRRCKLCNLKGGQKDALETFLNHKRDHGTPIFRALAEMLTQLSDPIYTNDTSIRDHYEYHWDGKKETASKTSR